MKQRVLMIMSSNAKMGVSGKRTGSWFDEVATPYYTFTAAGVEVVFASPKGGAAPIDHLSMQAPYTTENTEKFLRDPVAMKALSETNMLNDVDTKGFDAVFFPGGYGLLWDLASDSTAIHLVEDFYRQQKSIAFVCHAPALLRDAKKSNGEPLVKGLNVTGFMNAEDDELELSRHLLFSVEDMLKERGGNYRDSGENWSAHVEEDGPLMTGQNPASAQPLAEAMRDRLLPGEELPLMTNIA